MTETKHLDALQYRQDPMRPRTRDRLVVAGRCLAVLTLVAGLSRPGVYEAAPEVLAFRNVNVVPMDAPHVLPHQTVIVRGGVIHGVGAQIPAEAHVIDGRNGYLLPGLCDMHVHIADPTEPLAAAERDLLLLLANGVTSARCMRGFPHHLALRERVARGELLGPTLLVAGRGLDRTVTTVETARQQVTQQSRAGFDLIKVLPGLSRPIYNALADAANDAGIPFAGHVPANVGLKDALAMGQQSIEHLDGYIEMLGASNALDLERLQELVRLTIAAGAWNVPTMAVMETNLGLVPTADLLARPELAYVPSAYVQQWLKIRSLGNPPTDISEEIQRRRMLLLRALNAADARILFGTDSPQLFNVPGFSALREMRLMVASGLTPFAVLRSATARCGEYMRRRCGTIKAGQCADLLLVDRNPLEDLGALERVHGVMARGRWVPAATLREHLHALRERTDNYRTTSPRKGP